MVDFHALNCGAGGALSNLEWLCRIDACLPKCVKRIKIVEDVIMNAEPAGELRSHCAAQANYGLGDPAGGVGNFVVPHGNICNSSVWIDHTGLIKGLERYSA